MAAAQLREDLTIRPDKYEIKSRAFTVHVPHEDRRGHRHPGTARSLVPCLSSSSVPISPRRLPPHDANARRWLRYGFVESYIDRAMCEG
jgi:hypothetical protein